MLVLSSDKTWVRALPACVAAGTVFAHVYQPYVNPVVILSAKLECTCDLWYKGWVEEEGKQADRFGYHIGFENNELDFIEWDNKNVANTNGKTQKNVQ